MIKIIGVFAAVTFVGYALTFALPTNLLVPGGAVQSFVVESDRLDVGKHALDCTHYRWLNYDSECGYGVQRASDRLDVSKHAPDCTHYSWLNHDSECGYGVQRAGGEAHKVQR
jgi:hypothetical protein